MSFSETIFLFFLALVIFGPKKLPEIARQVGKVLNEFRRASNEFKAQIEQEISHLEVEEKKKTILAPSQAPEGTESRALSAGSGESTSSSGEAVASEATTPPATLAVSENNASPSSAETVSAEPVPTEQATEALTADVVSSAASQESHA